jgi:hypothetical protein
LPLASTIRRDADSDKRSAGLDDEAPVCTHLVPLVAPCEDKLAMWIWLAR